MRPELSEAFHLGWHAMAFVISNANGNGSKTNQEELDRELQLWGLNKNILSASSNTNEMTSILNSILDEAEAKWGKLVMNVIYLGSSYFACVLGKANDKSNSWCNTIVDVGLNIGLPQVLLSAIINSDQNEMVNLRSSTMAILDNLENTIVKCKYCGSPLGVDYDKCPKCKMPK